MTIYIFILSKHEFLQLCVFKHNCAHHSTCTCTVARTTVLVVVREKKIPSGT